MAQYFRIVYTEKSTFPSPSSCTIYLNGKFQNSIVQKKSAQFLHNRSALIHPNYCWLHIPLSLYMIILLSIEPFSLSIIIKKIFNNNPWSFTRFHFNVCFTFLRGYVASLGIKTLFCWRFSKLTVTTRKEDNRKKSAMNKIAV